MSLILAFFCLLQYFIYGKNTLLKNKKKKTQTEKKNLFRIFQNIYTCFCIGIFNAALFPYMGKTMWFMMGVCVPTVNKKAIIMKIMIMKLFMLLMMPAIKFCLSAHIHFMHSNYLLSLGPMELGHHVIYAVLCHKVQVDVCVFKISMRCLFNMSQLHSFIALHFVPNAISFT